MEEEKYDVTKIQILKGLEGVRRRPAMYAGDTGIRGLHHLLHEVVDNSVDEALAGHCTMIKVTLLSKNRVCVEDNGRGIPAETHPELKKSGLEIVMTTLHSGAKFEHKVYKISGGLHGVGVSVVNALSEEMEAEVRRNGKIYYQKYQKGEPVTPVKIIGEAQETGTKITFIPDREIFKKVSFNPELITARLREIAFLNPQLTIIFEDKTKNHKEIFHYPRGLVDFISYLDEGRVKLHKPIFIKGKRENIEIEAALEYTDSFIENIITFVNTINTHEGGTHLAGFKAALTKTLNEYAKKLIKGAPDLTGEDVREGLTAIISVKIPDPQFEGQTKTKLGNSEVRGMTESVIQEGLSKFLEENPKVLNIILQKVIAAAKSREAAKKARELARKKSSLGFDVLPGKLADCTTNDPKEAELFIVEGESAGGSAKQGRDRRFQAVLALKGKILNVEKSSLNKVLSNEEIKSIIAAIGAGIGGEEFNPSKIRYGKIIIMTDADVDGSHIRTLLLTLFYRLMYHLIENKMVYIAQPPLYRVKHKNEVKYLHTEEELEEFLRNHPKNEVEIQRFKGLGEMNPEQLWETTMNPEKRILKLVTLEDAAMADRLFSVLMGSEVEPRRKFIEENAKFVVNLDI